MKYEIDKKGYNTLGLDCGSDLLECLEDELENYSYICDGISEQADSCIDIYNSDLWESAKDFQEWTEEAIAAGLTDSNDPDLIKTFQMGQYQYYTQVAYTNEKELYFNILADLFNGYLNGLEDKMASAFDLDDVESKIDDIANGIDTNMAGSVFQDEFDEMIDELTS